MRVFIAFDNSLTMLFQLDCLRLFYGSLYRQRRDADRESNPSIPLTMVGIRQSTIYFSYDVIIIRDLLKHFISSCRRRNGVSSGEFSMIRRSSSCQPNCLQHPELQRVRHRKASLKQRRRPNRNRNLNPKGKQRRRQPRNQQRRLRQRARRNERWRPRARRRRRRQKSKVWDV